MPAGARLLLCAALFCLRPVKGLLSRARVPVASGVPGPVRGGWRGSARVKALGGGILAVSRSGKSRSTKTTGRAGIPGAPLRTSFAKIREPLEVPNLLALQTESFDWLIGNEFWRERTAEQAGAQSGLEEILTELSPIEDFSGSMSLSFSNPRFEEVKASIEECKDKDMTYAAPLFVTAEFTNNTTGEIKSQTVFMGDFPMMTRKGTFIING